MSLKKTLKNKLLLNCDLAEGIATEALISVDEVVMPYIDQANIACGFHAGNADIIQKTLQLAGQYGVMVGAHPSYADRDGFGRRSMQLAPENIKALIHYQLSAMDGMAKIQGLAMEYVKPHGALYNDMMTNRLVRAAIMESVATFHRPVTLMLQATLESYQHRKEAESMGIALWFEAFADRCYDDDGFLLSREQSRAVHDRSDTLAQTLLLKERGVVTTVSGRELTVDADTLCVHGDHPDTVDMIQEIRQILQT